MWWFTEAINSKPKIHGYKHLSELILLENLFTHINKTTYQILKWRLENGRMLA